MVVKMLKKSQLFCLSIVAVAYYYKITFSQNVEDGPVVHTKLGRIRGTSEYSRGGRKYFGYRGIPFAKPPTGNLRFEPTVAGDKWEGVRDGREFGSKCMQIDLLMGQLGGAEDCLTLNIFTPVEAKTTTELLPVLVYFHGGFFHNGGSDFWNPSYFMDENVLFVSLNFRLAALGFLNTGDGVIRGNMGMKDQSMGLKFISENIQYFGGDPARVTLLGESAGAVCSHLHMFSKMSRGLFNNVVSQSGSGLHFWAVSSEARSKKQAASFASMVGCPSNDSVALKSCLKGKDVAEIVEPSREMLDPLRDPIHVFKPSIEVDMDDGQTFLSAHPRELAKRGDFAKVPWINGVNSEEGLIMSASMLVNRTMVTIAQEDWQRFLTRAVWFQGGTDTAEVIRRHYFGNESVQISDPLDQLDGYTNMVSDRGFFYDTHHGATLQSQHAPVYLYYYSYRGQFSVIHFYPEITGTFSRQVEVAWSLGSKWVAKNVFGRELPNYGVSHSDELALLFYMPWVSEIYSEDRDYQMSIDLVKLWAEFAHDDSRLKFRDVKWPVVNSSRRLPLQYMQIDKTAKVIDEPFTERVLFWDTLSLSQT